MSPALAGIFTGLGKFLGQRSLTLIAKEMP